MKEDWMHQYQNTAFALIGIPDERLMLTKVIRSSCRDLAER
jgi:hypothetical protein